MNIFNSIFRPYGTDFGGITMLRPEDYIKANGMSNLFWGWGREDDDMQHRIELANLEVLKPKNYDQENDQLRALI